ncbi:alpha/beta fold hydrolase [Rhodococcus sp. BH5]|uniref:alpha/beta fold hydrolase n=1 Tax=Rhodococcus sp. BH5 TaxID=2871702 RepID=UPI0022CD94FD|nr:alpha/beta fold hydrolase [Rhodococcus sp. BH5]MCZ9634936.1 alpha/beta hydrolase [Rhodococcus sp. BH5]
MGTRTAMAATAISVVAVTASACTVIDTDTAITTVAPTALTWGDCESAFATTLPGVEAIDRLECSTVSVPLDYNADGGPNIDIAISRLPASSDRSRGPLIVNPGGPGLEGRSMPAMIGDIDRLSDWDIVGVDVRGTGASTRPSCTDLDQLSPPEEDTADQQTSEKALASDAQTYIDMIAASNQACADTDGPLLATLTAATAAADLDQIRTALGAPTISYFGASWGTELGLAYRTLFPEHLQTMVLDSAVYLGISATEQNHDLSAALAAERAADLVADDGARSPHDSDTAPAPAADPDPSNLPDLPDLADFLNVLTSATRTAYICNSLDAVLSADMQWSEHLATARETGYPFGERVPNPANSELPGASFCSGWATPGQTRAVDDTGTPLLLIGHRDETVTPYRWTTAAAERAGGTVMTVEDGNHGSALFGACSADLVAFLANTRTPPAACSGER